MRSLYQTSLYRRLILLAKEKGARIAETGKALRRRLAKTQRKARAYSNSHMDNSTVANSPIDLGTLKRTSAHYVTSPTHAHT
jgi:hypothetical protein